MEGPGSIGLVSLGQEEVGVCLRDVVGRPSTRARRAAVFLAARGWAGLSIRYCTVPVHFQSEFSSTPSGAPHPKHDVLLSDNL